MSIGHLMLPVPTPKATKGLLAAACAVLTAGLAAASLGTGSPILGTAASAAPTSTTAKPPTTTAPASAPVTTTATVLAAPTAPPSTIPAPTDAGTPQAVTAAPPSTVPVPVPVPVPVRTTPPPTTTPPAPPAATTTTTPPPPPPPTPPPPPAAPVAGADTGCEARLVARTNAVRAEVGLPALAWDGRAHAVSRGWSNRMAAADRISHNPRYGDELAAQGVDWWTAGENVGMGPADVVFDMWMASPAHRANLLGADYVAFAVACIEAGGELWITQNLWG